MAGELTSDEARACLDGLAAMHAEGWSPTRFCRWRDLPDTFEAILIAKLVPIARLDDEEMANVRYFLLDYLDEGCGESTLDEISEVRNEADRYGSPTDPADAEMQ